MKVLQIIDSLRPGGAERMAVNIANSLSERGIKSYLCATRLEGLLKNQVSSSVEYLFLNKKNALDYTAFLSLRKFVKAHRITIIHTHGSSWFYGLLLKWSLPELKLVWHNHNGQNISKKQPGIMGIVSHNFDGVVAVNKSLENWSKKYLKAARVIYFPNFLNLTKSVSAQKRNNTSLKGSATGFKMICVANLRIQKDYFNLLNAFELLSEETTKVSLHIIGANPGTAYALSVIDYIAASPQKEHIFYYGEQSNIENFLAEADLAVLPSQSEALPLAILEYAAAGLPVVCTDVGSCRELVGSFAKLVPAQNSNLLAEALKFYIDHPEKGNEDAKKLHNLVKQDYSEEKLLPQLLKFYRQIAENKL